MKRNATDWFCCTDFAEEAWRVVAHIAGRSDLISTVGMGVCAGKSNRELLLGLAEKAFVDGDLASARAMSLALRRALAAAAASSATASSTTTSVDNPKTKSKGAGSAPKAEVAAMAATSAVLIGYSWPEAAVKRLVEICVRALLFLKSVADGEAKSIAVWACLASVLVAGNQDTLAAVIMAATTKPAVELPAATAVHKDPLLVLSQSLSETLKSAAAMREDDVPDGESAVEVVESLSPATRKMLILAAGHLIASFAKVGSAAVRRQLATVLEAVLPIIVLLQEEKDAEEDDEDDGKGDEEEDNDGEVGDGDDDDNDDDNDDNDEEEVVGFI
jgi:hypothetical protein